MVFKINKNFYLKKENFIMANKETKRLGNKGFSLVEVVSTCPTNWGMTPIDALQWLRDNMLPYYPLGVYKDIEEGKE